MSVPEKQPEQNEQQQGEDSRNKLFRSEVFENKKETFIGKILIDKTMAPYFLPMLVIVILVIGALVAIFGSYTERVKVSGFLEPDQGLVRITSISQGVIKKVFVKQNQFVTVNDRLIDINNEIVGIDGVATSETILETLENSRKKLEEDLQARIALSEAQAATLDENVAGIKLRIASLAGRQNIQRRQTQMYRSQYNKLKPLADQRLIPTTQAENVEFQLINSQSAEAQLNEVVVQLQTQLTQVESERAQIPTTLAIQVSQVQRELAGLEERKVRTEIQTNTSLETPISGTVAYLNIKEAETINPGVLVATIIPEGSVLQAHLYAPSRVANRASIGNDVRIKYEAFVYQKYGTYKGKIIGISDSPISPQELPLQFAQTPGQVPEPLFRIVVELEQDYVTKGDERNQLQTGSKLQAEILLRKRQLYTWVFGPLFK